MRNNLTFNSLSTTNLSDNQEQEVAIRDFGGVDHSHSTLFVDTSRAVEMSNFIKENGINQKRKGWREIFQVEPIYENNNITYSAINGVWELTTSQYNESTKDYDRYKHLIFQASNKFYSMTKYHYENGVKISEVGITTEANQFDSQYHLETELINFPKGKDYYDKIDSNQLSYGVVSNERLYILTGKIYLMIGMFNGKLEVRKVEDDEFAYIPTTTINIPPSEYNNLLTNTDNVLNKTTWDNVNMMSRYRKNKGIGLTQEAFESHMVRVQINKEGLVKDTNGSYTDSSGNVVALDPYKYFTSDLALDTDSPITFTYTLDSLPFELDKASLEDSINGIEVIVNGSTLNDKGVISTEYTNYKPSRVNSSADFFKKDGGRYTRYKSLLYYVEYKDITTTDGVSYGTCNIVFNQNIFPKDSVNVVEIKYPRYTGLANRINKCRFGCMYGYNEMNRLFVSGNDEYPNIDYHSVESYTSDDINTSKSASDSSDLTYFSDLSYTKVGGVVNQINGYAILGDGKMAIFKTLSGQEPTIYFRTAGIQQEDVSDINGNSYTKITELYPIQVGTIGEGSIGFNTIQNLNGDTLMLSNNGLFGIELDSNVASSQRWAKRRSRLIDPSITKYDLSSAVCTSFNDKYFLRLEDSKVFVADARYPIKLDDDLDSEYQYEFWEWDNVPARLFFVIENKLWFGTSTGMLCCFEELNYQDTTSLDIDKSGICYVEDEEDDYNDKFVISPQYISYLESLSSEDSFFTNDQIYALGFETDRDYISFEDNQIVIDYSNEEELNVDYITTLPNYNVYIDRIVGTNYSKLSLNKEYRISSLLIDRDNQKAYMSLSAVKYEYNQQTNTNEEVLEEVDLTGIIKGFRICIELTKGAQMICNIGTYIDSTYYLYDNYREEGGKYYFVDKDGLIEYELESKPKFNYFSIRDYTNKGNPITIVNYNNVVPVIDKAKMMFNKNVSCYYITPPFDMGTRYYNKDLHKLIIVPDTLLGTSVDFGFKVSNYERDYNAYTGQTFSFNDVDFDAINFLTEGFAKVYVKQARKKRWSYIQFYFKSDTNNNCKINNLTIIYTIGTKNKGVR